MNKNKTSYSGEITKDLKELQDLVKHLIAVHLYINGATQSEICENLSISKTTVNNMVKGIKKDVKPRVKKEKQKKGRNANRITTEQEPQIEDSLDSNLN